MTSDDTAYIKTKLDLIAFLHNVRDDFSQNRYTWENQDIASFLDAFQTWLESSENYYINQGISPETISPWKQIADAFAAARIYE